MVAIKQQIVSQSVINQRSFGYGNTCNFITIHETSNENIGAGAQSHANLQSRLNPRQASWQYQVDDKETIQSFPDTVMCWAGGDGSGPGNRQSIHIEMCVNKDGNFKKTVQNTVSLVKHLMAKHKIPISNVVQHNRWSGKNCPSKLRSGSKGINWSDFIGMVKGEVEVYTPPKTQVGSIKVEAPKKPSSGYAGDSIVDYLISIGANSSFANRAKLAAQHGISGYKGTAKQNTDLLNKLRSGKSAAPVKPAAKKGDQKTPSVVDYLKSIGADSSFANRKKLAAKHGIKNYTGTGAQNTQLLKKLRG